MLTLADVASSSSWLSDTPSVGFVLLANLCTAVCVAAAVSWVGHRRQRALLERLTSELQVGQPAAEDEAARTQLVETAQFDPGDPLGAAAERVLQNTDDDGQVGVSQGREITIGPPPAYAPAPRRPGPMADDDSNAALESSPRDPETDSTGDEYGRVQAFTGASREASSASRAASPSSSAFTPGLGSELNLGARRSSTLTSLRRRQPTPSASQSPSPPQFAAPPPLPGPAGMERTSDDDDDGVDSDSESGPSPAVDPALTRTLEARGPVIPEIGAPRRPWSPVPKADTRDGEASSLPAAIAASPNFFDPRDVTENPAAKQGAGHGARSRSDIDAAAARMLARRRGPGEPETIEPDSMVAPALLAGALKDPSVGNLIGSYHGLESAVDHPELAAEISQPLSGSSDSAMQMAVVPDSAEASSLQPPPSRAQLHREAGPGPGPIVDPMVMHRRAALSATWFASVVAVIGLGCFCYWAYWSTSEQSAAIAAEMQKAREIEQKALSSRKGTSSIPRRVDAPPRQPTGPRVAVPVDPQPSTEAVAASRAPTPGGKAAAKRNHDGPSPSPHKVAAVDSAVSDAGVHAEGVASEAAKSPQSTTRPPAPVEGPGSARGVVAIPREAPAKPAAEPSSGSAAAASASTAATVVKTPSAEAEPS